jgi:hypothetical protein
MNANEIRSEVILGMHANAKAFLAPTIAALKAEFTGLHVDYSGSGGIFVDGEDRDEVIGVRDMLRATMPEFKVSRVWAFRSHTFGPAIFRFQLTVSEVA